MKLIEVLKVEVHTESEPSLGWNVHHNVQVRVSENEVHCEGGKCNSNLLESGKGNLELRYSSHRVVA
jgi:hypothetical protein